MEVPLPLAASRRLINFLTFQISIYFTNIISHDVSTSSSWPTRGSEEGHKKNIFGYVYHNAGRASLTFRSASLAWASLILKTFPVTSEEKTNIEVDSYPTCYARISKPQDVVVA